MVGPPAAIPSVVTVGSAPRANNVGARAAPAVAAVGGTRRRRPSGAWPAPSTARPRAAVGRCSSLLLAPPVRGAMEHIAAVFRRHAVDPGAAGGGGPALLPSVRVEEALREANVRDVSVGEQAPLRRAIACARTTRVRACARARARARVRERACMHPHAGGDGWPVPLRSRCANVACRHLRACPPLGPPHSPRRAPIAPLLFLAPTLRFARSARDAQGA